MKNFTMYSVITAFVLLSTTGCMDGQGNSQNDQTTQQDGMVVYGRINTTEPLRVLDYEFVADRQLLANKQRAVGFPIGVGTVVQINGDLQDQDQTYAVKDLKPVYAAMGIIEEFSADRSNYTVSGQSVLVDDQTVFGNTGEETLEVGNVVLVSGFYNSSGGITASRMDLLDLVYIVGISEIMVSGRVVDKKPSGGTFAIGKLVVEYDPKFQADLDDLQDSVVRVKGILRPDNGHLILLEMERAIDLEKLSEGRRIVMEGVVSSFASKVLAVNQVPVTTEAATGTESDVQDDVTTDSHVVLDGVVNAGGGIVAYGVQVLKSSAPPGARLKLVATIDELMEEGFTVLGQSLHVDEQTLYIDHSQEKLQTLGLTDFAAGDRVKVLAWLEGDVIHAILVERKAPDETATAEIKGLAVGSSTTGLQVAGVPVVVVPDQTRLLDARENFITLEELDAFLTGTEPVLEVKGMWNGGILTAKSAQLD